VGDLKVWLLYDEHIEKEEVHIQGSRTPFLTPVSPEAEFSMLKAPKEPFNLHDRLHLDDTVQEPALILSSKGLGLIQG
jgi:hypothetical protein